MAGLNRDDFYPPDFLIERGNRLEALVENIIKQQLPTPKQIIYKERNFEYDFSKINVLNIIRGTMRFVIIEKTTKSEFSNIHRANDYSWLLTVPNIISKVNMEIFRRGIKNYFSNNKRTQLPNNYSRKEELSIDDILYVYEALGIIQDTEEDKNNVLDFVASCSNGIR